MDKEYDVYYHRLAGTLSDELLTEEETTTEEATAPLPDETTAEMPAAIQLYGYETVFDVKVSLTPVELVPVIT